MKISKSEITLSAIALTIGTITAASVWIEHGSLGPFARDLGRGLMLCILLGIVLNHRITQIIHRQRAVDHKVDHVIINGRDTAKSLRDLTELAGDTEATAPLPPLRRYN